MMTNAKNASLFGRRSTGSSSQHSEVCAVNLGTAGTDSAGRAEAASGVKGSGNVKWLQAE